MVHQNYLLYIFFKKCVSKGNVLRIGPETLEDRIDYFEDLYMFYTIFQNVLPKKVCFFIFNFTKIRKERFMQHVLY